MDCALKAKVLSYHRGRTETIKSDYYHLSVLSRPSV